MTYFTLFACCLPVKGAKRSIICDLQRNTFEFIPNDLYNLLQNGSSLSVEEVLLRCETDDKETIHEYFDFLIEKEFGFYCANPQLFPPLDLVYKTPRHVTNSILDFDRETDYDLKRVVDELNYLSCGAVQLRYFDEVETTILRQHCSLFDDTRIRSLDLLVKYSDSHGDQLNQLIDLANEYSRITNIIVHSAPMDDYKNFGFEDRRNILFVNQQIKDQSHCGKISPVAFVINIETFTESQAFNSCLNKKISVDHKGNIKNCPSMIKSYGNTDIVPLRDVIEINDFKEVWSVNKDSIQVCQDCEFRHICTDCRAYTKDDSTQFGKPAGCSYDPYSATWPINK